jgi:hypothetical protein
MILNLSKTEDFEMYQISVNQNDLQGKILKTGTLTDILDFVQTALFNENTDFQNDAVFENLGDVRVIATTAKWYAIRLKTDLYQIIKTTNENTIYLPKGQTFTGSLNDLITQVYTEITQLNT